MVSTNSSPASNNLVFGRRLKESRLGKGLAQDKLGVLIGIDEHSASARISRYENGIHEPPLKIAKLIADALNVPLAFLFCEDDKIAQIILSISKLSDHQLDQLNIQIGEIKVNLNSLEFIKKV